MTAAQSKSESCLEAAHAYRYQILENAVREHQIRDSFLVLRAVGVEPILLKGWSVGRFYRDSRIRRLGDIDLVVGDEELWNAKQVLREHQLNIDWHKLSGLRIEFENPTEVVQRSELVRLLDTRVRVLCHEDNLHFVAIHMLRHGAWSPVWVRDVAVLVETRPVNFDWHLCLGNDGIRAGWVLTAIVIANELLGTDISGTPAEHYRIAEWLVPAIKTAQRDSDPANNQPPESVWAALAHPWRLATGIRKRWPNPITAAILTGVAFEQPIRTQLRYCANLSAGFLRRTFVW